MKALINPARPAEDLRRGPTCCKETKYSSVLERTWIQRIGADGGAAAVGWHSAPPSPLDRAAAGSPNDVIAETFHVLLQPHSEKIRNISSGAEEEEDEKPKKSFCQFQ